MYLRDPTWNETSTEYHIPFHNYAGPGTHITSRIIRGVQPINFIDEAALLHDIEYIKPDNKIAADTKMVDTLKKTSPLVAFAAAVLFKLRQLLGIKEGDPVSQQQHDYLMYLYGKHFNKVARE